MGSVIQLQLMLSAGLRRSLCDARAACMEQLPFLLPAFDGPGLPRATQLAARGQRTSFRPALDADEPEILFVNEAATELSGIALELCEWRPEEGCTFMHALLIALDDPFRYLYGRRIGSRKYWYALLLYDGEGRPESWIAPDPYVT